MLISRCAWHPFFCGYPRPLRVISWRGPGIAFTDTICRACAERVRIEGLWASSPPKPVWPGSAQTALLFVGLPLLMALVLMAAPLEDGTPPPARQEAAVPAVDPPALEAPTEPSWPPARAHGSRARRTSSEPVPPVIFETRRAIRRLHEHARETPRSAVAPAASVPTVHRRRPVSEGVTLAAVVAHVDVRGRSVGSVPQSP
jgi:hypothetical protein